MQVASDNVSDKMPTNYIPSALHSGKKARGPIQRKFDES